MTFKEFRKIVQDYCREFGLPFQSKVVYAALLRKYNSQRVPGQVDDDISVALFLDTVMEDMITTVGFTNTVSYSDLSVELTHLPQACVPCPPAVKKPCPSKSECKKETTMNNERDYLKNRVFIVQHGFDKNLRKQFFIDNDSPPKTAAELVARIQAGLYVLPDAKDDFWTGAVIWRDPSKPADEAGYEAASKTLKSASQTAQDVIQTQDAVAGLKALQDFQAWTLTTA